MNYKHVSKNANRKAICNENATTAKNVKKNNIAHSWQASGVISCFTASPTNFFVNLNDAFDDDEETNWITYHPLGSGLIHTMLDL